MPRRCRHAKIDAIIEIWRNPRTGEKTLLRHRGFICPRCEARPDPAILPADLTFDTFRKVVAITSIETWYRLPDPAAFENPALVIACAGCGALDPILVCAISCETGETAGVMSAPIVTGGLCGRCANTEPPRICQFSAHDRIARPPSHIPTPGKSQDEPKKPGG